jgi:hypothetical protein
LRLWDSWSRKAAPGLRALHGSSGIIAAIHCLQIVFSMELRFEGMHFCLVAREFGGRGLCRIPGRPIKRARLACLHFGRTISNFMNENNSAKNHLCLHRDFDSFSPRGEDANMGKFGSQLIESMKQAVAHAGGRKPPRMCVTKVAMSNLKATRESLDMSRRRRATKRA